MQNYILLILSLVIVGLTIGLFGVLIWVGRLVKANKKVVAINHEILSADERRQLKKQAAEQYEATLVRELKHFEGQLTALSTALLTALKADVATSDQGITQAANQLTTQLSHEYTGLTQQALSQLKLHIAAVEAQLATQSSALEAGMSELVAARKQAVLKRVDADLADILSQYLNATLEQLDLTDQEPLILAKLEEIKPQLKADIGRVQ